MAKLHLNCIIDIDENELSCIKDKFDLIEHIAELLFKKDMYMTVPELVRLLNKMNFKTDYETEYDAGRGSYKLVSSAYSRMKEKHGEYFANKLSKVFRTPNNTYPYEA